MLEDSRVPQDLTGLLVTHEGGLGGELVLELALRNLELFLCFFVTVTQLKLWLLYAPDPNQHA